MREASQRPVPELFVASSREYLRASYLPRLRSCLERLPAEDLWWRAGPAVNSVGNLLLHLAGNLRQWVVSGVGGQPDTRSREAEFEQDGGATAAQLLALLEETVAEADRALAELDPARLRDPCRIQGRELTVLEAVYHAVEHFGMHTGQVILMTKLRTGEDLGFYRLEGGQPRATWQ